MNAGIIPIPQQMGRRRESHWFGGCTKFAFETVCETLRTSCVASFSSAVLPRSRW